MSDDNKLVIAIEGNVATSNEVRAALTAQRITQPRRAPTHHTYHAADRSSDVEAAYSGLLPVI